MTGGSPPPLDAQGLQALRERAERVGRFSVFLRGPELLALLARVDDLTEESANYMNQSDTWQERARKAEARVDDLERANERLRTPPTDDDLLVIKAAISLLSHPRYDAEILARDAWECFERLTARVDELERERDEWQRNAGKEALRAQRAEIAKRAAEAEVARLTAEPAWRNEVMELRAEVARLRTALRDGNRFLAIFDSIMADESDGTRRIYSDTDLHIAASKFWAALSGGAAE